METAKETGEEEHKLDFIYVRRAYFCVEGKRNVHIDCLRRMKRKEW